MSDTSIEPKSDTIKAIAKGCIKRPSMPGKKNKGTNTNAAMSARLVKEHCQLDHTSSQYLEQAMESMNFSARAHDRILKVARTIADLDGSSSIQSQHILEAIQYRSLDRKLFS